MNLDCHSFCDVLVIGSGIAGIRAALAAANDGRKVILASSAQIFSGSSFFPGTWGFGLIGPENAADEADLAATIRQVGCDMTDPDLVQTFVSGIGPAIAAIQAMGIHLHRAANSDEREFIPCFDHKHRNWNRIEAGNARQVFAGNLADLTIETRPFCELLEIVRGEDGIRGAIVYEAGQIRFIACGALVLASGGFGGLFRHRLTTDDVSGSVQSLALKSGAELVNIEFMQIMPGYLSPISKVVFNEKTFRFAKLTDSQEQPLFHDEEQAQALLDERAGYGPFTSRLHSRIVDLAIFAALQTDPRGVTVRYSQAMIDHPPELIQTYFEWLSRDKNLAISESAQIGLYAHAANGGIRIAPDTSTGVPGLFACGEATGGMHGADRIGGLSTANGLVFGNIAGHSAARYAAENPVKKTAIHEFDAHAVADTDLLLTELRELMDQHALVIRTEQGLSAGLAKITQISSNLQLVQKPDPASVAATIRLEAQLMTARGILTAARLRRESRGSHYRSDYTAQDPAQSRPIRVTWREGGPQAQFMARSGL